MAGSPLTRSARGQECQIRIPGVCSGRTDTVVLCHLNGAGMGMKDDDDEGAYGCFECHQAVDGKSLIPHGFTEAGILLMHYEGVHRTRAIMKRAGLIFYVGMGKKESKAGQLKPTKTLPRQPGFQI